MQEVKKKTIGIVGANDPASIQRLLAAAGSDVDMSEVEIIDPNNLPNVEDLVYFKTQEVVHQIEMIKCAQDVKYSHLTKKQQEAEIKAIRNSKTDPKINRNEPCPCGSGKKYKRCCLSSCC
jgi:uncharacterized protein YecA (UPF0149 family)